jgi:hypothetical protein
MKQQYWESLVCSAELFLQCWKSRCFLCIESSVCGAPLLLTVRTAEWKSLWNIIAHSVSGRGLWLDRRVPLRNRQTKWATLQNSLLAGHCLSQQEQTPVWSQHIHISYDQPSVSSSKCNSGSTRSRGLFRRPELHYGCNVWIFDSSMRKSLPKEFRKFWACLWWILNFIIYCKDNYI